MDFFRELIYQTQTLPTHALVANARPFFHIFFICNQIGRCLYVFFNCLMNVRMLVYFVFVFSMYRLYGEQRSFVKRLRFLHQLQRQVTHHKPPMYFPYALVEF